MTNGTSKGITITGKNLLTWSAIIIIVISSIVDSALTRDQVRRNTKQLETYNLAILENNQKELMKKMDKVDSKMDEALKLITAFKNK